MRLRYFAEYACWSEMKQRCFNPKCSAYQNYGGRGITVCEEWKNSFKCFLKDMGYKPDSKLTIERIDNGGNYEPTNCIWETRTQQSRNRRKWFSKKRKISDGTKWCNRCKSVKMETDFYKWANKPSVYCKVCEKLRSKLKYLKKRTK